MNRLRFIILYSIMRWCFRD